MSVTEKLKKANLESADVQDKMGVCPFCYDESDPRFKIAQRQHDLDYVLHDAGLIKETRSEVDENFRKNLLFAAGGNPIKIIKALTLFGIASGLGWLFW